MPKDTLFNHEWTSRTDKDGIKLSKWLKQGSTKSSFVCLLCKTNDLDCANQGWSSILQHMRTKKHLNIMASLNNNSIFLVEKSTADRSTTNDVTEPLSLILDRRKSAPTFTHDELVSKAEIVWSLTVAQRGFSYNSSDEIGDVFRSMFPDSKIAESFSLQSKKVSYVISHGLGPHFHRKLVADLKATEKFVLCFDEQTNNQNRKQLDLLVKYWCCERGRVVTRYFKSVLLGHAQANVLRNVILDALSTDGIELNRLLTLARDNPSVNKTLENLIEEEMKKTGGGLLKVGSCNLHVVHNGFKSGISFSRCQQKQIDRR